MIKCSIKICSAWCLDIRISTGINTAILVPLCMYAYAVNQIK